MKSTKNPSPIVGILASIATLSGGIHFAHAEDYSSHKAVPVFADVIHHPDANKAGERIILEKDVGNMQLDHDFVYADPRRAAFNGGNAGVTYGIKAEFKPEYTSQDPRLQDQLLWMEDSLETWTDLQCADGVDLLKVSADNSFSGVVDLFFQTGNIFSVWQADITQVGFMDLSAFGLPPSVIGVAYTLLWADGNGDLTDIDGNGKFDTAFREIYYNDNFEWADDGTEGRLEPSGPYFLDFPTVAIHEAGHGLSVDHFGTIVVQDGKLRASPRAVMNALYDGTLREPTGRDIGGFCSNWAAWPNN